jgi:hypothetical protein
MRVDNEPAVAAQRREIDAVLALLNPARGHRRHRPPAEALRQGARDPAVLRALAAAGGAEAVFTAAPWIFRCVIFPMMDRRVFPRFAPFVISPALDA